MIRRSAKDYKYVDGLHKPKASPGILAAIMKPPLLRGDTSPIGRPTQTDTRRK